MGAPSNLVFVYPIKYHTMEPSYNEKSGLDTGSREATATDITSDSDRQHSAPVIAFVYILLYSAGVILTADLAAKWNCNALRRLVESLGGVP